MDPQRVVSYILEKYHIRVSIPCRIRVLCAYLYFLDDLGAKN